MKDIKNTFVEKLHECKQHKMRLLSAQKHLEVYMPLDSHKYVLFTDIDMGFVDQMIFRFSKLQDTMGEKLFPSLLELMGEEVKSKPFIDRLNRIEELGILYKNEWMRLRKDRNEIAHEYSFNQDEVIDGVNIIFESSKKLIAIFDIFFDYCEERFEFIKNSKVLNDKL